MSHRNPSKSQREPQQLVLLGASNLTLGLPWILPLLEHGFPGTLDVVTACGHGRSYGLRSRVLARSLPGIRDCGLWEYRTGQSHRPQVLITDVGNDIMYGATAETIADWVSDCVERCQPAAGQLLITQLPLASLNRVTRLKFRLIKTLLFPRHRITWQTVQSRAEQLARHLEDIAAASDAQLIIPPLNWYGIDPIHIRSSRRPQAWAHILSHWSSWTAPAKTRPPSCRDRLGAWRLRPQHRHVLGRPRTTPQPGIDRGPFRVSMF